MDKEAILKNLNEIQELVNDDKKFKYKNIVNFNCEHIKEELEVIEKEKNTDIIDNYEGFKNDNSEPSEALKTLWVLDKIISPLLEPVLAEYEDDLSDKITANYFALKQYLLKAREQEKENELLKEIIKSFFDGGCPLHQYTDKEGILQIEVDDECSTMHLGKFKDVDLDEKLKEVLEEL